MEAVPLAVVQVGKMYRVESQLNYKGASKPCNFSGKFKFTAGNNRFMVFEKTLRSGETRNITVFVDKLRVFPYNAARSPGSLDIDSDPTYETLFSTKDAFVGSASDAHKAGMSDIDEIPPPEHDAGGTLPCFDTVSHDFVYLTQERLDAMNNPVYAAPEGSIDGAARRRGSERYRPRSSSDGLATGSDRADDRAMRDEPHSMPRTAPMPRSAFLSLDEYAGENPMPRKGRPPSQGGRRSRRGGRRRSRRRSRQARGGCKARRSRRRAR